jgi:hypothetical protein
MNPDQIINAENDPRFREELEDSTPPEVVRERLVVPADMEAETKVLTERVQKARDTVKRNIAVSVSPSGKLRKNGPCLCGSGKKFKKCCQLKIKAGYIDPVSLSGTPAPHTVPVPPTRKLRKAAENVAMETETEPELPGTQKESPETL